MHLVSCVNCFESSDLSLGNLSEKTEIYFALYLSSFHAKITFDEKIMENEPVDLFVLC